MDCSTPGLPVPHHLLEFAQVQVHCIGDAIQPSHPLTPSSPSPIYIIITVQLFFIFFFLLLYSEYLSVSEHKDISFTGK